jgi:hypothetical protein
MSYTAAANQLINMSTNEDRIVRAPFSQDLLDALRSKRSHIDDTKNGTEHEVWGEDWRIHLTY